ncbi:MAG TPA: PilZ domain-containing protein, partial [Lacunisphaera sp.]|nr:PilZ domain-containing protein [Lacunisphaera sp.]
MQAPKAGGGWPAWQSAKIPIPSAGCRLDAHRHSSSAENVLLFKRILNFKKAEAENADKRGAKRYPVGVKSTIKAKLTLPPRDGEGNRVPGKSVPMDWGGQLADLSNSGASIRLHPAALAESGDATWLKLELDHQLFELEGRIAHFRTAQQHVVCGVILNFPDSHTRKAYLQLMEPVVIGSTLAPGGSEPVRDQSGLLREQYTGESDVRLSVWREDSGKSPRFFEMIVHNFQIRGSIEGPSLKIGYGDGARASKGNSRP